MRNTNKKISINKFNVRLRALNRFVARLTKGYTEQGQTSKIQPFAKTVMDWKSQAAFMKSSIFNVSLGSQAKISNTSAKYSKHEFPFKKECFTWQDRALIFVL